MNEQILETKQEQELKELNPFEAYRVQMEKMREAANFIPQSEKKGDEGYEKSRRLSLDINAIKVNVEAVRVEQKDYWIRGGKKVQSDANKLREEILEIQKPHLDLYKGIDNAEKIKKENQQTQANEQIEAMSAMIENASTVSSSDIASMIEVIDQVDTDKGFYGLTGEAVMCKTRVSKKLGEMYIDKKQAEQDAEELKELRTKQLLQDQKDHDELIAKQATAKADKDRLDAIKREEKAKQDAIDAENKRITQEKQFLIDAENAKIEAEAAKKQAKIDADNAIKQAEIAAEEAAEDARLDAISAEHFRLKQEKQNKIDIENARLAVVAAKVEANRQAQLSAENARLAEVARREAEDKAVAEKARKLEADKKHVGKIRGELKDDIMALGADEALAKSIVLAMSKKDLRHAHITY